MRFTPILPFILVAVVELSSHILANDSNEPSGSDELRSENHKAVVLEMKKLLESTKLVRQGKTPITAEFVPDPILNWDDLPRGHHHGTLWIWGKSGRPAAIIEMYTLNFSKRIVGWPGNTVHSLSAEPLTSEGDRKWNWAPSEPGFKPQPIKDAPTPAATKPLRQRQMRALAKRFSASESLEGNRTELRLLTTPVWLYESPDEALSDGGLFAFVHGGTNPEVILIIEANEKERTWQYGCVRLGHAGLQLNYDETEVWSVGIYGPPNPMSTYYMLPR